MLDSEFKKIIDNARDVLVGKVPDPKAQIEQITTAMIYKFMDYMDLENIDLGLEPQFFVEDYKQFSWSELMDSKLSGEARLDLYVQAITKLPQSPHLPPLFRNIFKGTFLPFRDFRTLNMFLKEIDRFDYKNSENLGNAFEYLLSILGSQGDAGQFRTPRHIIDFIVSAVDPKKEDTILDPACGTAGFLISAYKHIIKNNSQNYKTNGDSTIIAGTSAYDTVLDSTENYMGEMLTPYQKGQLLTNVTGYDISPDMVKLSLVNLYLHGFKQPKIFEYDTLSDDKRWDDDFDVVLANPPFMSPKGGITPHKRFSIQANRAELLFVDYIAEHLKIRGRAGIIVPEGIIFQASNAYKNLRKNLIENWGLYAVVSLPSGVFQPYSGVKTSILFLDKNLAKQSPDILFIKITNDGFDLGAQRRKIDKNDLPDALEIMKEWKQSRNLLNDEIAITVPKSKIAEDGDYNLTAERYKETVDYGNVKWDMVELDKIFLVIKNGKNVKQFDELGKYKVSRIQTIADGTVNLKKTKYTDDEVKESDFLEEGDILFSHINSFEHLAKTAIFKKYHERVVHGANLIKLKPNLLKANPKFIISLFKTKTFIEYARVYAQKAVNQASINTKAIKSLKIPLPPLEVQQEIVAEIEQYQKVIDGAKQVVESYKPQIEIDPEWEKVKLGELGKVCMCKRIFKEETTTEGDVPFYKIGTFGKVPDAFITNELFNEYRNKFSYPKKGDILISTSGTIGKTIVFDGLPAYFQDSNIVWIANNETKALNTYLNVVYKTIKWIPTRGGTIVRLYNKSINETKILLPPLSVQQEIVSRIEEEQKYVDGCKKLIEIYEEKIKKRIEKVWGK